MSNKIRLDVAVFEGGYAPSREKAKAIIMAGQVYVNNQKIDKAGTEIKRDDKLEVRGATLKYVSRGGLKLEKQCNAFRLSLRTRCVWMLAHLQAVLQIVCCKTEQKSLQH